MRNPSTSNSWPPLRLEPTEARLMLIKTKAGKTFMIALAALLATGCVQTPKIAFGQQAPAMSVAPETPEQFLGKIYKRYRANGPVVSMDNAKLATRVYDPALLRAYAKFNAARPMDIDDIQEDFFCNCQDYALGNVKISTIKDDYQRPVAAVTFDNLGQSQTVNVDLVRSGIKLLVTDIRTTNDSLRKALQRAAAARNIKLER